MLLYEGKAKQVYSTDNENEYIVYYKEGAANHRDFVKGSTRTKCSKKVATEKVPLAYNGTFVANMAVAGKDVKWYGRAYVRYIDANDQEQTYYAKNVIKY